MCVCVALIIQHAKRMRRNVLSSEASMTVPYFCTLFHKRHYFRKKVTEHKMYVLTLSTIFIQNISHFKNNSERYYQKCT